MHYLRLASYYVLELFSLAAERLSKMIDLMEWDHPQTYYLSSAVWVHHLKFKIIIIISYWWFVILGVVILDDRKHFRVEPGSCKTHF